MRRGPVAVFFFLLACSSAAWPQNHPELEWRLLETEHFRVLYHQGLEAAAARAAEVAEQAYGPVTRLYGYEPGSKVRIVLRDHDDYANGMAFFFQDTIEIWVTALEHDYELRGTSDWLRNVVTHEFVHIVSLGAARKGPQRVPALYLQYFGYQREKNRPDVLTGFPDWLASYPLMTIAVPHWFSEGVAQYQAAGARFDRWDSHRDMILRVAVLNGELLSLDDMGVFGKRGFGNEYVYDHGYALVRYIVRTYGEEKLAALCRAASRWSDATFGNAVEEVLGVSGPDLYRDWRATMQWEYEEQVAALGELRRGEEVSAEGFSNMWPAFSPDGGKLAFLSSRRRHYGLHALVLRDLESGDEEVLVPRVSPSSLSWSPDGRRLLFVRKDRADKYGSRQADIYEYDLDGGESGLASGILWTLPGVVGGFAPESPRVRRLSRGLRAFYPAYSPDGRWIAFVRNEGGSNNLGLMEAGGEELRLLTDFADGTQLYTPRWSPDGRRLVLSIGRGGQRDIVTLRVEREEDLRLASAAAAPPPDSRFEVLVATAGTDRDPVFSADGEEVIFASDFSGIFNVYAVDLETRQLRQLTNLKGGGLHPSVDARGTVAFAAYGEDGYGIRKVDGGEGGETAALPARPESPRLALSGAAAAREGESRPAGVAFLKAALLPRLAVDEGRLKLGLYAGGGDALGRQNIFAGAAVAPANGDRDLFLLYEYREWRPTLFVEFFHQRRYSSRRDSSAARQGFVNGVRFNLNQVSAGLRGKLGQSAELSLSATYDRYDASVEWDAFVPRRDGGLGFERVEQKPFGYTYLNGIDLGLTYRLEAVARRQDRDINPRGRRLYFRCSRLFNFFLEGFNDQASFIDEEYANLFYNQFTLDWRENLALPGNATLGLRFYGGWIDSDEVDDPELVGDFFDYRLGGLPFMKGYTFYSIEGRKAAMGNLTLRFPLLPDIRRRVLHLYFERIYGAVYGDVGKAWDGSAGDRDPVFGREGPLRDVGGQLRCDVLSYYGLPTRVQVDAAYGIDEVKDKNPWKFYLTVLFGYL